MVGSLSSLFLLALCLLAANCGAENQTVNITDFGARGDAVRFQAGTVSNSTVITIESSNRLSSADIGKLILLFGAGPATTLTNHQDFIGRIVGVRDATHAVLSAPAGCTATQVDGVMGTQDADAFQRCVDACAGTGTVVKIPAGTFLLVPPAQLTNFVMKRGAYLVAAAVTIQKGGISFQGAGRDKTVLLGCGAWKLQGGRAYRGLMFLCEGPIANHDAPLTFENLTLDGGVPVGNTARHGYPASVLDGSGWDGTHDAVVDRGRAPLHRFKAFINCRFTHWRGEMLKSLLGGCGFDGFILVTNCVFDDGNASGFNFTFTHDITGCTFSNLFQVLEFYEGYCSNACCFQNNLIRDITGNTMAICGALTNHAQPDYRIRNNTFDLAGSFGILTTPAQNLYITGNRFVGTGHANGIGLGCAGYQGTAINSNVVVAFNDFTNIANVFCILGRGQNRIVDSLVCSNTAVDAHEFATGYGWSTNVVIRGNVSSGGLVEGELKGQWFLDDLSNQFPPRKIYGRSGTNVISYVSGARQQTFAPRTDCVFELDDSQPEKIPPGAVLEITHEGKYPAPLFLSTTRTNAGLAMMPQSGCTILCDWTNGEWSEVRSQ